MNPISRRDFLRLSVAGAAAAATSALLSACQPTAETTSTPSEATHPTAPPLATTVEGTATSITAPFADHQPIGMARGLHPGRVVWAHNPNVTKWDGKTGFWWQDKNTDQALVDEMLSQTLHQLTGQTGNNEAWAALFEHFNASHGKAGAVYQPGEKIAIKINLNGCTEHGLAKNACFSSPQVIFTVLNQLVAVGVPASDIAVYDAVRFIPDAIFTKCQTPELEGVGFYDFTGGDERKLCIRDTSAPIQWSFDVRGNPTYLPTCLTEARYLINLSSLKGHSLAGVTLSAKNHFGTIMTDLKGQPTMNAPQGANLHGFIAAHNFDAGPDWRWKQRPMGTYTPLVDMTGHSHLGEKTLLFLLDGLYGVEEQNTPVSNKSRFQSDPFNDYWPSSLFAAQDGVALDSVGLDFLRSEPIIVVQKNVMPANTTCENYLHESALAYQAPSGTVYIQDGKPLPSLGVHEHWNNRQERQYSRNLGTGEGIELVTIA